MSTLQRSGAPQAIQTRYKGYHFRSRLEARWAVFLDAFNSAWEYEVEGFDLSPYADNFNDPCRDPIGLYLPDFLLNRAHSWLEIKPDVPEDSFLRTRDEELMLALCEHSEVKRGIIVYGMPDPHGYCSFVVNEIGSHCLGSVQRCQQLEGLPVLRNLDRWVDAIEASRSARFEHGQKGRT